MLCSLVILAKGVNITNYIACAIMTVIVCSIIVNVSIKKPVKIAMKVSPIEAVRVMITDNLKTTVQNKYRKFTPISLGIMNFKREPKKSMECCYIIESWRNYFISGIISFTFAISGTMAQYYFGNVDYKLYIDSDKEHTKLLYSGNPLNENLKQEISKFQV